jgi:hypothetical protein
MNIEFYTDDSAALEFFPPQPANKAIPEWYRDIDLWKKNQFPGKGYPTVKHCVPVQDLITSGYIIFNSFETVLTSTPDGPDHFGYDVNVKHRPYIGAHHHEQCPVKPNGKATHYFKIAQPWMIRTPPGYSCLIQQPFYHFNRDYQLLPAIVDTDKHDLLIEIPGYLTTDQPVTLESGAPLVQVIPFLREDWKMTAGYRPTHKSRLDFILEQAYRKLFHSKKSFK